jgi:methyl-accepting chemotaxis protein
LQAAVAGGGIAGSASFQAHNALVAELLLWLDDVADASQLALDPHAHTYHLMLATLDRQPQLIETLAQLRGRGNQVLSSRAVTAEERAWFVAQVGKARSAQAGTERAMSKSAAAEPALAAPLAAARTQATAAAASALALVDSDIVQATEPTAEPAAYWAAMTRALEAQFSLSDHALAQLGGALEQRAADTKRDLLVTAALMLLALALGTLVLNAVGQSLGRAVQLANKTAGALAVGDLRTRIEVRTGDEIGRMTGSMRQAVDQLSGIVADVRSRAADVATASTQISQGNADLAQRTEEQAAALQQSAGTVTELARMAERTGSDAERSRSLAGQAHRAACDGSARVGELLQSLDTVSRQGQRIGQIVGTIDSIAFQTNLLALNAALRRARSSSWWPIRKAPSKAAATTPTERPAASAKCRATTRPWPSWCRACATRCRATPRVWLSSARRWPRSTR